MRPPTIPIASSSTCFPATTTPDGETYAIRCTRGDLMMTRCADDLCRVQR